MSQSGSLENQRSPLVVNAPLHSLQRGPVAD